MHALKCCTTIVLGKWLSVAVVYSHGIHNSHLETSGLQYGWPDEIQPPAHWGIFIEWKERAENVFAQAEKWPNLNKPCLSGIQTVDNLDD